MTLPPLETETVRLALAKVKERFEQAETANDLDAMLQHLCSTRDGLVSACITIQAVRDAMRAERRAA